MAYIVFVLYFCCLLAQALTVTYDNSHLQETWAPNGTINNGPVNGTDPHSTAPPIIAAILANKRNFASFWNGCFIFSVLSAANTSLYVASRTLYGLAYESSMSHNVVAKAFGKISKIQPSTGVPIGGVIVSMLSFYWLPWLRYHNSSAVDYVGTRTRTCLPR